jgi:hypothetical protein
MTNATATTLTVTVLLSDGSEIGQPGLLMPWVTVAPAGEHGFEAVVEGDQVDARHLLNDDGELDLTGDVLALIDLDDVKAAAQRALGAPVEWRSVRDEDRIGTGNGLGVADVLAVGEAMAPVR